MSRAALRAAQAGNPALAERLYAEAENDAALGCAACESTEHVTEHCPELPHGDDRDCEFQTDDPVTALGMTSALGGMPR